MTQSLRIASTNQFYIDIAYIFSRKPFERQRAGGIVFFDFSFRFGRRQTLRKMGVHLYKRKQGVCLFYYMGSGRIFRCKRSDEVWGVNGVTAGIWSLGA